MSSFHAGFIFVAFLVLRLRTASTTQLLLDDADETVAVGRGWLSTELSYCPATINGSFHHDGLLKSQVIGVIFNFVVPVDGCYMVEERHPMLWKPFQRLMPQYTHTGCIASAHVPVVVNFGKNGTAAGSVDQRIGDGDWKFLGSLPFFTDSPSHVSMSNAGTDAGTIVSYDSIRLTRTADDCDDPKSKTLHVEIQMRMPTGWTVGRLDYGRRIRLHETLSNLSFVPQAQTRLESPLSTHWHGTKKEYEVIAVMWVLPSAVLGQEDAGLAPEVAVAQLTKAIQDNQLGLCSITTHHADVCSLELVPLGAATPSLMDMGPGWTPPEHSWPDWDIEAQEKSDHSLAIGLGVTFAVVIGLCAMWYTCRYLERKQMEEILGVSKSDERFRHSSQYSSPPSFLERLRKLVGRPSTPASRNHTPARDVPRAMEPTVVSAVPFGAPETVVGRPIGFEEQDNPDMEDPDGKLSTQQQNAEAAQLDSASTAAGSEMQDVRSIDGDSNTGFLGHNAR